MSQQTAMRINLPFDKTPVKDDVCESCVLTVLLAKNNVIKYYEVAPENNPVLLESGYSPEQIRKVLMDKKYKVAQARGSSDAFILIIKPTAAPGFKNFVNITNEAKICETKRYYIDEVKPADRLILDQKL